MAHKSKVFAKIPANGPREDFNPPLLLTLEELQKFVGGYIQMCGSTIRRRQLCINEEGLIKNLPVNAEATKILDPHVLCHDGIRGNALLLGA